MLLLNHHINASRHVLIVTFFSDEKIELKEVKCQSPHCGAVHYESDCSSSGRCGGVGFIPSPAQWVEGSRHCHSYSSDSIPGPGTSICHRCSKKKRKKKKERERNCVSEDYMHTDLGLIANTSCCCWAG